MYSLTDYVIQVLYLSTKCWKDYKRVGTRETVWDDRLRYMTENPNKKDETKTVR